MTVPSSVLPARRSKSGSFDSNEFRAGILIYFLSLQNTPQLPLAPGHGGTLAEPDLQPAAPSPPSPSTSNGH